MAQRTAEVSDPEGSVLSRVASGGDRPVRLTVVIDAGVYGGAERQVVTVLERLPASYTATVLATEPVPPGLGAALTRLQVTCRRIQPVTGKFQLVRLASLVLALRRTRADLVHVNMATATNNRHAVTAAVLLRRPTVVSVHSLAALDSPAQRRYLGRMLRAVRAAMVPAQSIAEQLVDVLGVAGRRVHVVRNGVAVTEEQLSSGEPQQHTVRVVTVGRLSPEKGQDVLIDACRDLVERGRDVQVVVVGDGPQRASLERRAEGLPVTFTGEVDDPHQVLATADVYCQPARTEGLPLALLEAMMDGLPCVASAVGDIPSLVPDVLVVPSDDVARLVDALDGLVEDPQRRAAMGAAARRRAMSDHTVDQLVRAVLEVYAEALR